MRSTDGQCPSVDSNKILCRFPELSLCVALFSPVLYSVNPNNHNLPNIKLHLLNSRRLVSLCDSLEALSKK